MVALACAAGALLLTRLLYEQLGTSQFAFCYAAVALSAWRGGLGPGLLAAALSLVGIHVLIPAGSGPTSVAGVVPFVAFAAVAALIAWITGSLRRFRIGAEVTSGRLLQQQLEAEHQAEEAQALGEELEATNDELHTSLRDAEEARQLAVLGDARRTAILEVALDCVIGMDHEGRVTDWNPAAERIFGWTREQAAGREMAELIIPPALRQRHRTGLRRYLETGEARVLGQRLELPAMRADGTEFPVEIAILRIPVPGPPSFVSYVRDISERKDFERALVEAKEAAETANRSKSEFLAVMSHELRTPLNAIAGYADLMAMGIRGPVTPEQHEDLVRITRSQRHLLGLINDVLDFSKLEAGRLEFHLAHVPVAALLSELDSMVAPQLREKQMRYECLPCADVGLLVYADAEKVRQILLNVIANAIKFTAPGGRIAVSAERRDGVVAISVSDTGIGIPPDKLHSIFEPFMQVDSTHRRAQSGTGLGLAISRQLARAMGGELTAESVPGESSTFTVTLPASDADRPPAVPPGGPTR